MSCLRERSGRTSLARVLIHSSIQAIRSLGPPDISLIGASTRSGPSPNTLRRMVGFHLLGRRLPCKKIRRLTADAGPQQFEAAADIVLVAVIGGGDVDRPV